MKICFWNLLTITLANVMPFLTVQKNGEYYSEIQKRQMFEFWLFFVLVCSFHHDLWYFNQKKYSNSFIVGFKHPWSCTILLVLTLFAIFMLYIIQISNCFFIGGNLWMKFHFLWNMEAIEVTSIIISLASFGQLNILNKM